MGQSTSCILVITLQILIGTNVYFVWKIMYVIEVFTVQKKKHGTKLVVDMSFKYLISRYLLIICAVRDVDKRMSNP